MQYADAAEMATILNQLFQSGRLRAGTGAGRARAGARRRAPLPGARRRRRRPAGAAGGADRPPLIVRRAALELAHRPRAQGRDGDDPPGHRASSTSTSTGGRRVFIYYAENAKAKDLGGHAQRDLRRPRDRADHARRRRPRAPRQVGRRAGEPLPPPPPPPAVAPGGPLGEPADAPLAEGQVRFIADEMTNAIIVTTYAAAVDGHRGHHQAARPDAAPGADRGAGRRDRAHRRHPARRRLGAPGRARFRLGQQAISRRHRPSPTPFSLAPAVGRLVPLAGGGLTAFAFASRRVLRDAQRARLREPRQHRLEPARDDLREQEGRHQRVDLGARSSPASRRARSAARHHRPAAPARRSRRAASNQTVEYRDAGVVLTVTPAHRRARHGGPRRQAGGQRGRRAGAADRTRPSFIKREAETSVVLLNNQTLVLGGLIQDRVTVDDRGIPFFKNIPILGYLFGFKEKKIEKTELLHADHAARDRHRARRRAHHRRDAAHLAGAGRGDPQRAARADLGPAAGAGPDPGAGARPGPRAAGPGTKGHATRRRRPDRDRATAPGTGDASGRRPGDSPGAARRRAAATEEHADTSAGDPRARDLAGSATAGPARTGRDHAGPRGGAARYRASHRPTGASGPTRWASAPSSAAWCSGPGTGAVRRSTGVDVGDARARRSDDASPHELAARSATHGGRPLQPATRALDEIRTRSSHRPSPARPGCRARVRGRRRRRASRRLGSSTSRPRAAGRDRAARS